MDIDKFFNKVNPFEWETTEPKEDRDFGKNDMIKFAKMYLEAINYSQCCETLNKKLPTSDDFDDFIKKHEEIKKKYR